MIITSRPNKKEKKKKKKKGQNRKETKNLVQKKKIPFYGRFTIKSFDPDLKQQTKDWIYKNRIALKKSAPIVENILASHLGNLGIKFIRQCPFAFPNHYIYFADFYLPKYNIVVEVDGSYHASADRKIRDLIRDCKFQEYCIKTIRVNNIDVGTIKEPGCALEIIKQNIPNYNEHQKELKVLGNTGQCK